MCYMLFFKQKTAYELRISDWISDVCSSDLDNTVGSMPGNGTKLKKRNTIKAPKVNQRRFLRSVACENFAKLILDAIWSALDAISALILDHLLRRAACPSPLAAEAVPVELFKIRVFFEHIQCQ